MAGFPSLHCVILASVYSALLAAPGWSAGHSGRRKSGSLLDRRLLQQPKLSDAVRQEAGSRVPSLRGTLGLAEGDDGSENDQETEGLADGDDETRYDSTTVSLPEDGEHREDEHEADGQPEEGSGTEGEDGETEEEGVEGGIGEAELEGVDTDEDEGPGGAEGEAVRGNGGDVDEGGQDAVEPLEDDDQGVVEEGEAAEEAAGGSEEGGQGTGWPDQGSVGASGAEAEDAAGEEGTLEEADGAGEAAGSNVGVGAAAGPEGAGGAAGAGAVEHVAEAVEGSLQSSVLQFVVARTPGACSILELRAKAVDLLPLAAQLPSCTWVVSTPDPTHALPPDAPLNALAVDAMSHLRLQATLASPHLFDYLLVMDFMAEYSKDGSDQSSALRRLGQLLSAAKVSLINPYRGDAASTMATIKAAASQAGLDLRVLKSVPGASEPLLAVEVLRLERPVLHHFADNRPADLGGTCFHYLLSYAKPPSGTASRTSGITLCRVQQPYDDSGRCFSTPQCSRNSTVILLEQTGGVPVAFLQGMAAPSQLSARVVREYAYLPYIGECMPWNLCIEAKSLAWCRGLGKADKEKLMGNFASRGCAQMEFDNRHDGRAACCFDTALLQHDGCGLSPEERRTLRDGSVMPRQALKSCRQRLVRGFQSDMYDRTFLKHKQEANLFAGGREPERMSKPALLAELLQQGLIADGAGQNLQRRDMVTMLEQARLNQVDVSEAQLDSELLLLGIELGGPNTGSIQKKKNALRHARWGVYRRVKTHQLAEQLAFRAKMVRKGLLHELPRSEVQALAADMRLPASAAGSKEAALAAIQKEWERHPHRRQQILDRLQMQLQMKDQLFRSWQQQQGLTGESGAAADASRDPKAPEPTLRAPDLMDKGALQKELRSAKADASGSKEELVARVKKLRRRQGTSSAGEGPDAAWHPLEDSSISLGLGSSRQEAQELQRQVKEGLSKLSSSGQLGAHNSLEYSAAAMPQKMVQDYTQEELVQILAAEGLPVEGDLQQLRGRLLGNMKKEELVAQARVFGLRDSGTKLQLLRRVSAKVLKSNRVTEQSDSPDGGSDTTATNSAASTRTVFS